MYLKDLCSTFTLTPGPLAKVLDNTKSPIQTWSFAVFEVSKSEFLCEFSCTSLSKLFISLDFHFLICKIRIMVITLQCSSGDYHTMLSAQCELITM